MVAGDTIAAISSPAGAAARIILRLSGPRALEIARHISSPSPSPSPQNAGDRPGARRATLTFADLNVPAWVYAFHAPRSYSGEDLIEFHLPGNPLLAGMLLEDLLRLGARSAEPGEFTARAYFNGRLDLTEAEGVAATISAHNEQELRGARQLMAGELARRLRPGIEQLAQTLALIEAGIDFSEEDISFIQSSELGERLAAVDSDLDKLVCQSARLEQLAYEPKIVLAGRPNAGKSTLLNVLCGQTRSVVSDVAGTTRDALWAELPLSHGMARLIDVAGLEALTASSATGNDDPLSEIQEQMRRQALAAVEEADFVVLVRDISDPAPPIELPRRPDMIVWTKLDLRPDAAAAPPAVSAKSGAGLEDLKDRLDRLVFAADAPSATLALNARHLRAIAQAREALGRAIAAVPSAGLELIAMELREAIDALGSVTGAVSPDDILGRIFSSFCIGK